MCVRARACVCVCVCARVCVAAVLVKQCRLSSVVPLSRARRYKAERRGQGLRARERRENDYLLPAVKELAEKNTL